jgi:hypothetical protein
MSKTTTTINTPEEEEMRAEAFFEQRPTVRKSIQTLHKEGRYPPSEYLFYLSSKCDFVCPWSLEEVKKLPNTPPPAVESLNGIIKNRQGPHERIILYHQPGQALLKLCIFQTDSGGSKEQNELGSADQPKSAQ